MKIPHLPTKERLNKDVIIKSDDPFGINGEKVTLKNIKKVIKNINKIYEKVY